MKPKKKPTITQSIKRMPVVRTIRRKLRGEFGPRKKTLIRVQRGLLHQATTQNLTKPQIAERLDKTISKMSVKYALDAANIKKPETRKDVYLAIKTQLRLLLAEKMPVSSLNRQPLRIIERLIGRKKAKLFYQTMMMKYESIKTEMAQIKPSELK